MNNQEEPFFQNMDDLMSSEAGKINKSEKVSHITTSYNDPTQFPFGDEGQSQVPLSPTPEIKEYSGNMSPFMNTRTMWKRTFGPMG